MSSVNDYTKLYQNPVIKHWAQTSMSFYSIFKHEIDEGKTDGVHHQLHQAGWDLIDQVIGPLILGKEIK